jgi:hypothetical protein
LLTVAPLAADDAYQAVAGELLVSAPGVLANDSDADGDLLEVTLIRGPSNGQLALEPDGSFRYLPRAGFSGRDTFSYRATGGGDESEVTTVTISVQNSLALREWSVAEGGNGHFYAWRRSSSNWADARNWAEGIVYQGARGHLATITSAEEQAFAFGNSRNEWAFLGGYQDTKASDYAEPLGGWRWITGEPWEYEAWNRFEPNDFPAGRENVLAASIGAPGGSSSLLGWSDALDSYAAWSLIEFSSPAPFAASDRLLVPANTATEVSPSALTGNDRGLPTLGAELQILEAPAHGSLARQANGSFLYSPEAGYEGRDRLAYRMVAPGGNSNVAYVWLGVGHDDFPTIAGHDQFSLREDEPLDTRGQPGFSVLANDADADGVPLRAVLETGPAHGTLQFQPDGTFLYVPAPNFNGQDTFRYRATDGRSISDPVTVTLNISSRPDNPVSQRDAYEVAAGGALSVPAASGLLANDTDIDSDQYTFEVLAYPQHGTLTRLNNDGSFEYIPDATFEETDGFVYRIYDHQGGIGNPTHVTLARSLAVSRPLAVDDYYPATQYTPLVVDAASGVLGNDLDLASGVMHLVLTTAPAHGSMQLRADGSFEYWPRLDFAGRDSFSYRAVNANGESSIADVQIEVITLAADPLVSWPEADGGNGSHYLYVPGVAEGWQEARDRAATLVYDGRRGHLATITSQAESDRLPSLETGPAWLGGYQDHTGADYAEPAGGWRWVTSEPWSFTQWDANDPDDQQDGSIPAQYLLAFPAWQDATVWIWAAPLVEFSAASPPARLAGDDVYKFLPGQSLEVPSAEGVLQNDVGLPAGARLEIAQAPLHGTLALNDDGSFRYVPSAGPARRDQFTYRVVANGQTLMTSTAWLSSIDDNRAPTSVPDEYSVLEDAVLTVDSTTAGVLANDEDRDHDALSAQLVDPPGHGTLTWNTDGTFTYRPAADFAGEDVFAYRASDGKRSSALTTVKILVEHVNDAPQGRRDAYVLSPSGGLAVDAAGGVLANDLDVDGDSLTVALLQGPSRGRVVLQSNGAFEYLPGDNFEGFDAFSYTATDGTLTSAPVQVIISTSPLDQAPIAVDDRFEMRRGEPLRANLLSNDYDVQGDSLRPVLVRPPEHGQIVVRSDGGFDYSPAADFWGEDTFIYRAVDATRESNNALVRVVVRPEFAPQIKWWSKAEGGNGHGYALLTTNSGWQWEEVNALAQAEFYLGTAAHLATLTTAEENAWVGQHFPSVHPVIGGAQENRPMMDPEPATHWSWVTGEPWEFTAWGEGQPDSLTTYDFVVLRPREQAAPIWDDTFGGSDFYSAVIEYPETALVDLIAADDLYRITRNEELSIPVATGLRANDNATGTAQLVSGPQHGQLELAADGSFRFRPNAGYLGRDAFQYRIVTDQGATNTATVWLNVGTNDLAPVAEPETYYLAEDSTLTIGGGAAPDHLRENFNGAEASAALHLANAQLSGGRIGESTHSLPMLTYSKRGDLAHIDFVYEIDFSTGSNLPNRGYSYSFVGVGMRGAVLASSDWRPENSLYFEIGPAQEGSQIKLVAGSEAPVSLGAINGEGWHRARIVKTGPAVTMEIDAYFDGVFQVDFTYTVADVVARVPGIDYYMRSFFAGIFNEAQFDNYSFRVGAPDGPLANDLDYERAPLSASLVSGPNHGVLTLGANGGFQYTPAANFVGVDRFTYRASDGGLSSRVQTVTLVVEPRPDSMTAVDDSFAVDEAGSAIDHPAANVREWEADFDQIVYDKRRNVFWGLDIADNGFDSSVVAIDPVTGHAAPPIWTGWYGLSLALADDGSALFVGRDSSQMLVRIDLETLAQTTLDLPSQPRNPPERVVARPGSSNEVVFELTSRGDFPHRSLAAYRNFEGVPGSGVNASSMAYSSDGSLAATYEENWDGGFLSLYSADTWELMGRNQIGGRGFTLSGEMHWSGDQLYFDHSPLVFSPTTLSRRGLLPVEGENLVDSAADRIFVLSGRQISVVDARSHKLLTTFTVPDAPESGNHGLVRWGEGGLAFQTSNGRMILFESEFISSPAQARGVLANDLVLDETPIVAELVTNVAHGTLEFSPQGWFVYRPAPGFLGIDQFQYRLQGVGGASNVATVKLQVSFLNDPPETRADYYELQNLDELSVPSSSGVLANDRDEEGSPLAAVLVTAPQHGQLTLNADGSFIYRPAAGAFGPDYFEYRAFDGQSMSVVQRVNLQVHAVIGDVALRLIREPTTVDRRETVPAGEARLLPGEVYYLEIWIRDASAAPSGIDSVTIDLELRGLRTEELIPTDLFTGSNTYIDDEGQVKWLSRQLAEGEPQLGAAWGRLVVVRVVAKQEGDLEIVVDPRYMGRQNEEVPQQNLHRARLLASTGLPADANGDGRVDLNDFAVVKSNFGRAGTWSQGDFNGDGLISLNDFGILKTNFGRRVEAVPVAASAAALAAPALAKGAAVDWLDEVAWSLASERMRTPSETSEPLLSDEVFGEEGAR